MSSFTTPLKYQQTDQRWQGRKVYRLTAPFHYDIGQEGSEIRVHVPSGFHTDFASIPRLFQGLFPPDGPWAAAAVLHDWLYFKAYLSRWMADRIFLEAMEVLGVKWWQRYPIYYAVRAFGWRGFGKRLER